MLLFILFFFLFALAASLFRFLAVFVQVSLALYAVHWVAENPHVYGGYFVALLFLLLAVRAVSRWVNKP
ncbi:hypothetical protein FF36_06409 [Frankia torreyi]|uniref:Uncharacterized protein n=1 Tax=Frankia torreyi TaxID=1856 RepID=A0A0D8B5F0_9ACTN|nr:MULTISPECIES: hypothetical protein [Frankia]KJE19320.1 hypothetical protein FF36_06409 [Frankia torreyi]KQM01736.1 hypothetical protein FF86_11173 [Frankia sp. CpI1-P]